METPIKPNVNPAAGESEKLKTDTTILAAAQAELMPHCWDAFVNDPPRPGVKGSVVPGCPTCRKILYSDNQYLSHLAIDVLPGILEKVVEGARPPENKKGHSYRRGPTLGG